MSSDPNVPAYENIPYEGSEAYRCTMGATFRQLLIRKPYAKMAVEFHKKFNNIGQVEFFESELKLIDERLNTLKPDDFTADEIETFDSLKSLGDSPEVAWKTVVDDRPRQKMLKENKEFYRWAYGYYD